MQGLTPFAHVSIHDVAPDTLGRVEELLSVLREAGADRVMLLVIPGQEWTVEGLDRLRAWSKAGHPLAGHGWVHRVAERNSLYHKLHGVFLSRYVAEHLALDGEGVAELMRRCHDWFPAHDLPAPTHYVPPAWALGPVTDAQLRELPYRTVEVLGGVKRLPSGRVQRMPLLGYEADTGLREIFLKAFNAWNVRSARRSDRCARISLHPHDLHLRLGNRIASDCRKFALRAEVPGEGAS